MNPRSASILREMGLGPIWQLRLASQPLPQTTQEVQLATAEVPPQEDRAAAIAQMDWPALARSVAACRACPLCQERQQAVLGVGDPHPDWLFIGEGPGAEEDRKGEPFVGPAGRLLDAMLAALGLDRRQGVYIANTVKCRPPDNRTPATEEIAACWPYLQRQIELSSPKLIVALGKPAAQTLLQREVKIGAERGKLHDYRGIGVVVTYHPAYLLRNLADKAKSWEDLCFARSAMENNLQ